MNDKISIIVPVYNVEKYLDECIQSIINQTYKNIEIIIINDGSTDNSLSILRKYESIDKRIIVINQENKGLSASRNIGIKKSTGKYISLIDSDDVIHPRMVELLYKEIKKNNCDISICMFQEFTDNFIEKNNRYNIRVLNQDNFLKELLKEKKFGSHACNKLYKKSLFNNVEYVVGRKYEDIGTTYKLGLKSNLICYIDIELYGYRIRESSITCNLKKDTLIDYVDMVNKRYNDLIFKKKELKKYIDLNRINCVTRFYLVIAYQNKIELLKDKEIKKKLDNELLIAKKLTTREINKNNSLDEKLAIKLLMISPYLFIFVMKIYKKLKS